MSETKTKTEAPAETHAFQAEVKQVLELVIHSLYKNKEAFLRELISNASDAFDKLRFAGLKNAALIGEDNTAKVYIDFDKKARTITIRDNGIGMSKEEVISNLGTIAKSGTKEFLAQLTGDQTKDTQLIGQFGVGFYAAFIVANKVQVITRRADLAAEDAVIWESAGDGSYTLASTVKETRGTDIILRLKADEDEFLDDWRLRHVIHKYSDHLPIAVLMKKTKSEDGEKKTEEAATPEYETVNRAAALWTLPKNELKDSDYKEFYKSLAHDYEDPLIWAHNRVEGKHEYTSLLYVPAHAPFDLWNRDKKHGLKLYVKRVFITEDAEQFLPVYLRFVKGVIDCNDLPLNVSRELLQQNKIVESIRGALTKRVLGLLETLAQEGADKYASFWEPFGSVLKEGIVEDSSNREALAKLLRFHSTHETSEKSVVSLADYVSRMKPEQKKIYFITADTLAGAKNSPHLEIFRKKNIEVLLLVDRIDEWLTAHLTEFEGKSLQSITQGKLDLGELSDPASDAASSDKKDDANQADLTGVIEQMKKVLGSHVKDVRISQRLTESPSCVVSDEQGMNSHMERILRAAGQEVPKTLPIFEINAAHPLITQLQGETEDERFAEWTHLLFQQALLAESGHLENPADFVKRMNRLLGKA